MTVEQFFAKYDRATATPVEVLCARAIGELNVCLARMDAATATIESEVRRVRRELEKKQDLSELQLNSCGEIQSHLQFNMVVAEIMEKRDTMNGLLRAVELERSGKREWWREL